MFKKVLVANRGEIAIRVMRACRELGISTVGVYSEADKNALFAKYADEAYLIEEEGPIFIGPPSHVIAEMGNKIRARHLMMKAGVPVVPGTKDAVDDVDEAKVFAENIGYPVIIKASAGGGGIGMKVAHCREELVTTFGSTRQMAGSAFGDSSVFIEKYLEEPRHIEIQILADSYGNTIYLSDRECSIQRRHQKLIEEAPSPIMTPELRVQMGEAAVKVAKAIGYVNAGTVEFLYSRGDFYFLEVNTRLQVEHGITEMVTGIDIVKEQLRIAWGEKIDFLQEDICINGHAIECRINAEDPLNDFAPSPGKIRGYRSAGGPGVRVDSGVHTGYTISPYYDSMISKLCVWERTRDLAIARMERALYEYVVVGVKTNIPFHKAVMRNPDFRSGDITTAFIEDNKILESVEEIVKSEAEKGDTLASAIEAKDKKVAAITAAVYAYVSMAQKMQR